MCLHKLCADAQLLVDLFVNFDCHLDASNSSSDWSTHSFASRRDSRAWPI